MEHLSDAKLIELAEGRAATHAERAHLAGCDACRRALDQYRLLMAELDVASAGVPAQAALERYYALADEIQSDASATRDWLNRIVAVLRWDGREQPALAGQRGERSAVYRLLYAAPGVEIELMVEPIGAQRHIEGDLIPLEAEDLAPALIQLSRLEDDEPVVETESAPSGRFQLSGVAPGEYRLNLFGQDGSHLVVDRLELS